MTEDLLGRLATQGVLGLFCAVFGFAIVFLAREVIRLQNQRFTDIQELASKVESREEQRRLSLEANTQVMRELSAAFQAQAQSLSGLRAATEANTQTIQMLHGALLRSRSGDRNPAVR